MPARGNDKVSTVENAESAWLYCMLTSDMSAAAVQPPINHQSKWNEMYKTDNVSASVYHVTMI